jgi:hypothetical protein
VTAITLCSNPLDVGVQMQRTANISRRGFINRSHQ